MANKAILGSQFNFHPRMVAVGSESLVNETTNLFGKIIKQAILWQRRRTTSMILRSLNQHQLEDIGLCRGDLERAFRS